MDVIIGDSSPLLNDIVNDYVIPFAIETNDRWLLTTGLWFIGKMHDAIRSIVVPYSQIKVSENSNNKNEVQIGQHQIGEGEENDSVAIVNDPTLFILYQHVKQIYHSQELKISPELEYHFSLQVTRAYERLGCPLLSLYILLKYPVKRLIQKSSSISNIESIENNEKENGKQELSRAADLFADDDTSKSVIENDIFADMDNTKPSGAIDLFDDDDKSPKFNAPADIFADLVTKPSYSANLFDDDDKDTFSTTKINTSINIFDTEFDNKNVIDNDDKNTDSLEIDDNEELSSYKAQLVLRMVQVYI